MVRNIHKKMFFTIVLSDLCVLSICRFVFWLGWPLHPEFLGAKANNVKTGVRYTFSIAFLGQFLVPRSGKCTSLYRAIRL